MSELTQHVIRYLEEPSLERDERAKLVELVVHKTDGNSTERVASFVLDALNADARISHRLSDALVKSPQ